MKTFSANEFLNLLHWTLMVILQWVYIYSTYIHRTKLDGRLFCAPWWRIGYSVTTLLAVTGLKGSRVRFLVGARCRTTNTLQRLMATLDWGCTPSNRFFRVDVFLRGFWCRIPQCGLPFEYFLLNFHLIFVFLVLPSTTWNGEIF